MALVLYFLAKALRIGTGYLYKTIMGLRTTTLQNATHFYQCQSVVVVLLLKSPLVISSDAVWNLFAETSALGGFHSQQGILHEKVLSI